MVKVVCENRHTGDTYERIFDDVVAYRAWATTLSSVLWWYQDWVIVSVMGEGNIEVA